MKKYLFCILMALPVFGFCNKAIVVSVVGKAEVKRNGVLITLLQDTTINEGEVITTGFKSEVVVRYNGSVMKIAPLSRVTLEKLSTYGGKDKVSVFLQTGNIKSTVNHAKDKRTDYVVRNQVAVASVRGTAFSFSGNGNVSCNRGQVSVGSPSSKKGVLVGAGSSTSFDGGSFPSRATVASLVPIQNFSRAFCVPNDAGADLYRHNTSQLPAQIGIIRTEGAGD